MDINTKNTMDFYNERAQKIENMECIYTSVLLGDQNPKHAQQWNIFEKEHILPDLHIDENSIVLDIGCGIGRWAESIIPKVKYYFGVDFSEEMIKVAKKRCVFKDKEYDFYNASFQEIVSKEKNFFKYKFNRIIIGGVCMYINDKDLEYCLKGRGFKELLDDNCIMYLTETVAIETRLTLDECPSEALKANYDVIYRTPEEYNEYYKGLINEGFEIVKQGYLPHLNDEKAFSETDRWYTILKK